jgi:prevent-host-death family protein
MISVLGTCHDLPDDYNDHNDYFSGMQAMDTDTWTVAEAKAKLSEVIENAHKSGPQTITRNGRRAVVVVDAEEWDKKTRRTGNLAEFLAASPLPGSSLKVRRPKDRFRPPRL